MMGFARTTLIGEVLEIVWSSGQGMATVRIPNQRIMRKNEDAIYRVLFSGETAQQCVYQGAQIWVEGMMVLDDGPAPYVKAQRFRVV